MSTTMAEAECVNCTTTEPPPSPEEESYSLGVTGVIFPIIMVLISAVGITGNSLVLHIIFRHRDMRTVTNSFVASLALTDIAILIICVIPTATVYVTNTWELGDFLCRLASYTQAVTVQATCFTLTAMTVDRYYLIVHAVKSRNTRTVTKAVIINITIWIVSALIHLASFVFTRLEKHQECSRHFPNGQISADIYAIFAFLVMYALPLLVILFCYTKILIQIWRKQNTVEWTEDAQSRAIKRKRKVTKMVFIVVVLFALCWAPIQAFNTWTIVNPGITPTYTLSSIHGAFVCIAYLNSCVNPFVYAFTTASFKKYFKHYFGPCCRHLHQDGKSSSLGQKTALDRLTTGKEQTLM